MLAPCQRSAAARPTHVAILDDEADITQLVATYLKSHGFRVDQLHSGREVGLTTGEYELLHLFARHPGRVLSREFMLESTRGREAGPFDRTIDVQVARLRKKLEFDPEDPHIIKSVRGVGYILVSPVAQA